MTFKARPNISVFQVGGCWGRRGRVLGRRVEEGSGKAGPDQPEAPASVGSGGRSGQDSGLCLGSRAPPRGSPTCPFPRPRCSALGDDAPAPLGCISEAATHSVGLGAAPGTGARPGGRERGGGGPGLGPQARAERIPGALSRQVKGQGAGGTLVGGSPKKALRFSAFDHAREGVIYRKE